MAYQSEEAYMQAQEDAEQAFELLIGEYMDALMGIRKDVLGGWWDSTLTVLDDFKVWIIDPSQDQFFNQILEGNKMQAFFAYSKARAQAEVESFDAIEIDQVLRGEHVRIRHIG
jgi:hypothetical protein